MGKKGRKKKVDGRKVYKKRVKKSEKNREEG